MTNTKPQSRKHKGVLKHNYNQHPKRTTKPTHGCLTFNRLSVVRNGFVVALNGLAVVLDGLVVALDGAPQAIGQGRILGAFRFAELLVQRLVLREQRLVLREQRLALLPQRFVLALTFLGVRCKAIAGLRLDGCCTFAGPSNLALAAGC